MGRAYAYAPLDAPTVTARKMCRVLDAAESREVVLARFVAELDPSDVPVLRRLLDPSYDDQPAGSGPVDRLVPAE